MAKSAKSSDSDPRQKLLKELRGLIKDIDEEGLLFLIKQANTLIYNQRVDELNRETEELQREKGRQRSEAKNAVAEGSVVIERGSFGRSYIVDFRGMRKTFAESEMLGLVKVAQAAGESEDGAARLLRWLKRNRDDVLLDVGIADRRDSVLGELYTVLRKSFALRDE